MTKRTVVLSVLVLMSFVIVGVPNATAQNAASNIAFFVAGANTITLASTSPNGVGPVVTILNAPNSIKTSSVGALQASVSLECSLWTFTTVTASSGGGKQTVSSRAGVEVWVEVDGMVATPATPGRVVYCDRYQAVGLNITSVCSCTVPGSPCSCTVTDTITSDLFQRTKNANSFNFFIGPLNPILHSVVVKAQGVIGCTQNGSAIDCPAGVLREFEDAKTAVAIGKRTLVLEEHNNFGVAP